jgi:predicted RNA-binding protein with PIN domain
MNIAIASTWYHPLSIRTSVSFFRRDEEPVPYLIDGHNLIAAIPEISLSDLDDEQALIQILANYARSYRKSITVYFDRGSLLAPPISNTAKVTIHFARPPRTADDAIRSHIERLGREASNWTVISSDREVTVAAQRAGARTINSQAFASQISTIPKGEIEVEKPDPALDTDEIEAWEKLFNERDDPDSQP